MSLEPVSRSNLDITELCFIPIILDAVVLDPGHQALAFLLLLLLAWRHRACVQATRRLDSGPGKSGTFLQTIRA